jgi:hypothetical protein
MPEKLTELENIELKLAGVCLEMKYHANNHELRTSAELTMLAYKLKIGQIHPDDADKLKAAVLDRVAYRDRSVAIHFRSIDLTDISALAQPIRQRFPDEYKSFTPVETEIKETA